ncbi:malto-oligosyltrehalose synthase [Acetobacter sp. P5B1]|uniref:malto-oligosyltrehalose synthase n=1 Tax=Acetobacter sp. P5B1 TaxID=2762620 RepID=UPI001C042E62|nr:malto-oligosyltrehalose synthase [Acetobacter sp. P5B1]
MTLSLRATYRIQFHKDYTLYDAISLVPYLKKLGISHIYASPLLASASGSLHGYDTISWDFIDSERGGEKGLLALVETLRAHDMGLILDIVPNHMTTNPQNAWWQDVLQYGRESQYAYYFDINWSVSAEQETHKIILPFLEKSLEEILEDQKIRVSYQENTHSFVITYEDKVFPLAPESLSDTEKELFADFFNPETLEGKSNLLALLQKQHYQLVWWQTTGDLLNWRRFFDVTALIALRMERPEVFARTHAYVFDLYRRGLIDGIRVDHVDGLLQPARYCQTLLQTLNALTPERPENLRDAPIIFVEKILSSGERLPENWPVSGTTGYDFLEQVSLLLHHPAGEERLNTLWAQLGPHPYAKVMRAARDEKLNSSFYKMFQDLAQSLTEFFPPEQNITQHAVACVLQEILLAFPVYRIYFSETELSEQSRSYLSEACEHAEKRLPAHSIPLLMALKKLLSQISPLSSDRKSFQDMFVHLTAPLVAKSGEDTAFYRYDRLLSRNEVGTDPAIFCKGIEAFHQTNLTRLASHPQALLCTATHDHKRGEDGRARLMVLSEPEANWTEIVALWFEKNKALHMQARADSSVSRADEFFFYQTLISAWPVDTGELSDLPKRLETYLTKALRERGLRTSWADPDADYEESCQHFIRQLLQTSFVEELSAFVDHISPAAALNSLTQIILRSTVPGVPDLYQGREEWDFSLVDPDNRRPVDYSRLGKDLEVDNNLATLASSWRDGRIKQHLLFKLLKLRENYPQLFINPRYEAVSAQGELADHVVAFQCFAEDMKMLVIVTRFGSSLSMDDSLQSHEKGWNTTHLSLTEEEEGEAWESILWGNSFKNSSAFGLDYFYGSVPFDVLIASR